MPKRGRSWRPLASSRCGNLSLVTGWRMRRGEIRLTDLDPALGSEANKRRPSIVVSNDRANTTAARLERGVVTVGPVTSNVDRVFPF